jgi:hypothetical protein
VHLPGGQAFAAGRFGSRQQAEQAHAWASALLAGAGARKAGSAALLVQQLLSLRPLQPPEGVSAALGPAGLS